MRSVAAPRPRAPRRTAAHGEVTSRALRPRRAHAAPRAAASAAPPSPRAAPARAAAGRADAHKPPPTRSRSPRMRRRCCARASARAACPAPPCTAGDHGIRALAPLAAPPPAAPSTRPLAALPGCASAAAPPRRAVDPDWASRVWREQGAWATEPRRVDRGCKQTTGTEACRTGLPTEGRHEQVSGLRAIHRAPSNPAVRTPRGAQGCGSVPLTGAAPP